MAQNDGDRTITSRLGLVGLDIADVPFGYNERLEFTQVMRDNLGLLDANILGATTASINLFVSTTGDDSNPGTESAPFANISSALGSLPRLIRHPVTINVGSGMFTGSYVSGFMFDAAVPTSGAYLVVQGTMQTISLGAGPASGTVATAQLGSNLTQGWGWVTASNSPGWVDNSLRGHHVVIVSGTGAGQVRPIAENSSNAFRINGAWATVPDATSYFEIKDPVTTIFPGVSVQSSVDGATSGTRSFIVQNIVNPIQSSEGEIPDLIIQQFILSGTTRGIHKSTSANVLVRRCRVTSAVSGLLVNAGGPGAVTDCIITGSFTTATLYRGSSTVYPNGVQSGLAARNFVYGQGNIFNFFGDGARFSEQANSMIAFAASPYSLTNSGFTYLISRGCYVSGSGGASSGYIRVNGANPIAPGQNFEVTGARFDNCSVIFEANGPAFFYTTTLTGSGNGTAFSLSRGARAAIASTVNAGAGTDLSLDGNTFSYATFRAQSPVGLTGSNNGFNYGTLVFGF